MRGDANVRSIFPWGLEHGEVLGDDDGVDGIDEADALDGVEIEVVLHERLVVLDDLAYLLLNGVYLLVEQLYHLVQTLCLILADDLPAVEVAHPVLDIELALPVQFTQSLHRLVRHTAELDGVPEAIEIVGNLGGVQ